ncbi:integrating conjugative element protein [Salinicola endophyticus]|uniref:Integrating conjugative element protein n=1 Tax=Salinicola endophyticus TaxID=1949083 RepID=A0AB74UAI5_9GAMM
MTYPRNILVLTLLLAVALTSAAEAQESAKRPQGLPQLTVVADHGGISARPYYVAINGAGVDEGDGFSAQPSQGARSSPPFSEQDMLPIASARLTPGHVQPRQLHLPGGFTPIFLVGDDDLSRRWLAQRGDVLRKAHAVGLVVQVETEAGLQALRQAAEGLELRPVSGDGLAQRLGLHHYPVLISERGIEQ